MEWHQWFNRTVRPDGLQATACSFRFFANRNYFESAMKLAWAAPFAIFLLLIQLI